LAGKIRNGYGKPVKVCHLAAGKAAGWSPNQFPIPTLPSAPSAGHAICQFDQEHKITEDEAYGNLAVKIHEGAESGKIKTRKFSTREPD